MAYSDKVIDHYENPRNVGTLDKSDDSVGTGLVGAPACGDVMRLQLRINPETDVIEDAKFKTFGCGSAIASASPPAASSDCAVSRSRCWVAVGTTAPTCQPRCSARTAGTATCSRPSSSRPSRRAPPPRRRPSPELCATRRGSRCRARAST